MCHPLAIAAITIATTGAQIYATNRAAKSAFKAQHSQAVAALEEKQDAAAEALGARMKEYRKTRATARVAGGESGAQGQSYSVGLNQLVQDANMDAGVLNKNLALGQRQVLTDLASANANVRTVSGLEAGLQIAAAGVSGYSLGTDLAGKTGSTITKVPSPIASSTTGRLPSSSVRVS
jgi:hypothetical protein